MDREKTALGIREMLIRDTWQDIDANRSRYQHILNDAIALLKEQEAVKPIPPEDEFGLYRCGKCYHQLFRCVDKYCSRCGRAVKWDG